MPGSEDKHTVLTWSRIYKTASLLLSNTKYLKKGVTLELVKSLMTEYSLSRRQAYRIIKAARQINLELSKKDTELEFNKSIAQREYIINSFLEGNDLSKALDAIKDRDKLNGLYNLDTKQEITVKNVNMSKFTEHGLQRLIKGDKIELVLTDPMAIKND